MAKIATVASPIHRYDPRAVRIFILDLFILFNGWLPRASVSRLNLINSNGITAKYIQ